MFSRAGRDSGHHSEGEIMNQMNCTAVAMSLCVAGMASAGWTYSQSWDKRSPAFDSFSERCNTPSSSLSRVTDDWIASATVPVKGLRWWGTSGDADRPASNFTVLIWQANPVQCTPQIFPLGGPVLLASWCVEAVRRPVGTDCDGKIVYEFTACLNPQGFMQFEGERYWLQISENDKPGEAGDGSPAGGSSIPGLVEFRWSGVEGVRNCPALQFDPLYNIIAQPLFGTSGQCEGQYDLAFELFSEMICGRVPPPPPPTGIVCPPPCVFIPQWPWNRLWWVKLDWLVPNFGTVVSSFHEFPVGEDGALAVPFSWYCAIDPFCPYPNSVNMLLSPPSGAAIVLTDVPVNDGSIELGQINAGLGDANSDTVVNFLDITTVLSNFGAGLP
jgi:hypothetical protein